MPTNQAFSVTGLLAVVTAACVTTAPPNATATPPNAAAGPPNAAATAATPATAPSSHESSPHESSPHESSTYGVSKHGVSTYGVSTYGVAGREHLLTVLAIAEVNGGDVARAASALGAISLSDRSGSAGKTGGDAHTVSDRRQGDRREPLRGAGGAAFADFESLKQLIQTTVNPDTWEDLGGPSSMFEYPQGVFVDPAGTVHVGEALPDAAVATLKRWVDRDRQAAASAWPPLRATERDDDAWLDPAPIRCVSLTALLDRWARRERAGRPIDDAMVHLAGLSNVRFVWIDDDEIVLAGRVGGIERGDLWYRDRETSLAPIRLADLAGCVAAANAGRPFGCTIDPTPEGLRRAVAAGNAIRTGRTPPAAAAETLRAALGAQRVEVFGTSRDSRLAAVMVEADRHMKRLALGDQPMPAGVRNYFTFVRQNLRDGLPDDLLLRLWFAPQPMAVRGAAEVNAFELAGPAMRLSGQNERALASGRRGRVTVDPRTDALVDEFNENLAAIRQEYPVYAALEAVYRAAAVAEVMCRHAADVPSVRRVVDQTVGIASADVAPDPAPGEVDSVVIHRSIRHGNRRHHLVIASGGVEVDPKHTVADKLIRYAGVATRADAGIPPDETAWWWEPKRP